MAAVRRDTPTPSPLRGQRCAAAMRVVAGEAKGRRLAVPAGPTRPTSDRAREALFSSLASLLDLDGARVLDLFAGSGAVGLEALSRGAATAVLVDSDRRAHECLRRNIEAVGITGAELQRRPVLPYLAAGSDGTPFDLVFADPPYAFSDDDLAAVLAALADHGWLAPGTVVVVERSARSPQPAWPDCVTPVQHRRYGAGVLWYGRAR